MERKEYSIDDNIFYSIIWLVSMIVLVTGIIFISSCEKATVESKTSALKEGVNGEELYCAFSGSDTADMRCSK